MAAPKDDETTASHEKQRRPSGRSERVRESVATAVLALLAEERVSFGAAEVADRAGVHRTTVYRRWPTRSDLMAEALSSFFAQVVVPDAGSWEADVHALADELARFFADPVEIGVVTFLAVAADPAASRVIQDHWRPIVDAMLGVVDRAKARGEVDGRLESGRLVELLTAPFVVWNSVVRQPVTTDHITELADLVVAAGRPWPRRPEPSKLKRQLLR